MKKMMQKTLVTSMVIAGSMALTSCGGGGSSSGGSVGNGGGSTSTWGQYQSPYVTVTQFIDSLNYVDGPTVDSYLELDIDETYRTIDEGLDDWFVIWDDKLGEHKAVSLQYVRSIVYYDYMSDSDTLAAEFRDIEADDIAAGDLYGDYYGDNYETVEYDSYTDSYWGVVTGFEYEDEAETTDVNLLAAESQEMKFFRKAEAISYEFSISMPAAMSVATLGSKMSNMVAKGNISDADLAVLSQDVEKLTGVSVNEMMEAATNDSVRTTVMDKASKKLGTTSANIEQRLLPELFGISL